MRTIRIKATGENRNGASASTNYASCSLSRGLDHADARMGHRQVLSTVCGDKLCKQMHV
jgi:hypothetical protein